VTAPSNGLAGRSRSAERARRSSLVVTALAIAGGTAGCHPTGDRYVDFTLSAALAAGITAAAAWASRWALLVFSAGGLALSRSYMILPAAAGALVALWSTFQPRAQQRVGALIGAAGSQVALR
jgi:hypothetical protein